MHLDVIDLRKFYYRTKLGADCSASFARASGENLGRYQGADGGRFWICRAHVAPFFEISAQSVVFDARRAGCDAVARGHGKSFDINT